MPSARATALTRRHRRELAIIGGLVGSRVADVARTFTDTDSVDAWWEVRASFEAQRLTVAGHTAASAAAARYLRNHAAIEERTVQPLRARASADEIAASLRIMGPVEFKRHMQLFGGLVEQSRRTMVTTLSRSAERLALNGDRETVMATFADSSAIVGWQRVTGASPCAFCATLASGGAVFSKESVDFQAHDGDQCSAEPLYKREPDPEWVRDLRAQWEQSTEGLSGDDALNAFRRVWEGRDV